MDRPLERFADQLARYVDRPHTAPAASPVGGRAAWLGSKLSDDRCWEVELDDLELADLDLLMRQPGAAAKHLTAACDRWLHELQDGLGFVLVRGLPVHEWSEPEAKTACWALGSLLGHPGAQNGNGDLVGHVTDFGAANEPNERLYRTNHDIGFHCDSADIVGLLCLRPAKEGGTSRLVSSVTVFNRLLAQSPASAARLFEPVCFDNRLPDGVAPAWRTVVPCAYDGADLRTFMHLDYMRSVTRHDDIEPDPVLVEALHRWEAIARDTDVHLAMDLQPGDLQLASNHTVVHARDGYVDDPGAPRHLLRLWLSLRP